MAGEIGAAATVRQLQEEGIELNEATVRSWLARSREQQQAIALPAPSEPAGGSRAERLRAQADTARTAAQRAYDAIDRLVAKGDASQARAAGELADKRLAQADAYDAEARTEEEHSARLQSDAIEKVNTAVVGSFEAVGLLMGPGMTPARSLWIVMLKRAIEGDDTTAAPPEAQAAQDALLAHYRDLLASEIRQEVEADIVARTRAQVEAERPAPQVVVPAPPPDEAPEPEPEPEPEHSVLRTTPGMMAKPRVLATPRWAEPDTPLPGGNREGRG
jgi:hypothetical protein